MRKNLVVALGVLLLGAPPLAAQDVLLPTPDQSTSRAGTRGADFLAIGVGGRAQALGGAYASLADDVTSLYWNVAGAAALEGFSAGLSVTRLYEDLDINHMFVGVVLPTSFANVGVSVTSLGSGEMRRTSFEYPEGGAPEGETFEWTSMAVGLALAKNITDRMAFGAGAKVIQEGIEGATATYVAADLGVKFETGLYGLVLGAALRNVGGRSSLDGSALRDNIPASGNANRVIDSQRDVPYAYRMGEFALPMSFDFSVTTDLVGGPNALLGTNPMHRVTFVTDVSDAADTDLQPAVGLEYGFRDLLYLRAGKRWLNEAQIESAFSDRLSFGAGVELPIGGSRRISLDYAFTDAGDLENVQVFSIGARF